MANQAVSAPAVSDHPPSSSGRAPLCAPNRNRDERQPQHSVRVLNAATQAGTAAQGVSQQVSLHQAEVLDQSGEIVAERLDAERSVNVTCVTVAL